VFSLFDTTLAVETTSPTNKKQNNIIAETMLEVTLLY